MEKEASKIARVEPEAWGREVIKGGGENEVLLPGSSESLETQRAYSTIAGAAAEEKSGQQASVLMPEKESDELEGEEETMSRGEWLRSPETILTILVITAQNGFRAQGFKNLSRAFRRDEQLWDAIKDRCGPNGVTHLMIASREGDLERVGWLLARSANVNARQTDDWMTPLMYASLRGHLEVVQLLIDKGANVNATTGHGEGALFFATNHRHVKVAKMLMERGANVSVGNSLMYMCRAGHLEMARLLVIHGADVNAARPDGMTPLIAACEYGHLETARLMIDKGGDVNAARSCDGMTSLMCATLQGHLEIARLLEEHGANVNAVQAGSGFTALMCASIKGYLPVMALLLSKGADKAAVDRRGCTALSHAKSPEVRLALEDEVEPL